MIVATNGIVVNELGQVLLIQRDDIRTWALPGGGLDEGELPTAGVAREVEEETGLKVMPVRLVSLDFRPEKPDGFLILTFRCLVRGGQLRPSAESLKVGFYPTKPLPRPMLSVHRERLARGLGHTGGPVNWFRPGTPPSLYLARFLLLNFIYPLKNLQRRVRGDSPFVPSPGWQVGAFTIIRNEVGQVLWIRRRDKDVWNLPGGGNETREAPWETAGRETREETGLEVRLTDLRAVYVKPAGNTMLFSFTAEAVGGSLTPGPESAGFAYFTPGEEPANSLPYHVQRVADAFRPAPETIFRIQDETVEDLEKGMFHLRRTRNS